MPEPRTIRYEGPPIGCWPIVILLLGILFIVFKYTPWLVYGAVGLGVFLVILFLIFGFLESRR